jgi:hypothetical protein
MSANVSSASDVSISEIEIEGNLGSTGLDDKKTDISFLRNHDLAFRISLAPNCCEVSSSFVKDANTKSNNHGLVLKSLMAAIRADLIIKSL